MTRRIDGSDFSEEPARGAAIRSPRSDAQSAAVARVGGAGPVSAGTDAVDLSSMVDASHDLHALTESGGHAVSIDSSRVVDRHFNGFGAEMNPHLYDRAGVLYGKAGGASDRALHRDVAALGLDKTRIFFNVDELFRPDHPGGTPHVVDADRYQSFVRTLQMAKQDGISTNLTWSGGLRMPDGLTGEAKKHAQDVQNQKIGYIADLMQRLHHDGFTNIHSITLENEPAKSWHGHLDEYAHIYKQLDTDLQKRGIRHDFQLIGGDLTHDYEPSTIRGIAQRLGGTLDGISFHHYWTHADKGSPQRFFDQLDRWKHEYPARFWNHVEIQEYGVKATAGGKPGAIGGVPVENTTEAAAEQGAFALLATQHGVRGVIKWDAHHANPPHQGVGDPGAFSMIQGPDAAGHWKTTPSYRMMSLINHAAGPGWDAVATHGTDHEQAVTAFRGPSPHDFAAIAINRTPHPREIVLHGVPAHQAFHVTRFNDHGHGDLTHPGPVQTANGTVHVTLAPYGAISLSSHPTH